ncbi:protein FAM185A [Synchiropus picturatus]
MLWGSVAQRGCMYLLRVPAARASRCLWTSTGLRSREQQKDVKKWTLEVSPFTRVQAHVGCSISVRPLDLHAVPGANRAEITVHGSEPDLLHVNYNHQSQQLLISAAELDSSVVLELAAPVKSSLLITTLGNGNVQVKNMECDVCTIRLERGDCLLKSIKGHQVEVRSSGGNITGHGTIHGNVDIRTSGDGAVEVKKLQGTTMNVCTEHGPLKVKAIYAESSCVSSSSGRVELGLVHGSTSVKNESGDTVIDGSNSLLKVSSRSGDIDVYVGEGASAELHSQQGAVCVRVPSSLRAAVELRGLSVDVSPEMVLQGAQNKTSEGQASVTGVLNSEGPVEQRVKAEADQGPVRLKTQSWFDSLKLGR